tara:strand:- start:3301 stop:3645 length:345 start_codon:yes stop_codon:yes gene_type:complete
MKHLPLILFSIFIIFFIKKRFFDTTNYKALLEEGVIIDVRSTEEFMTGNIENSINIPLTDLSSNLHYLKDKNQPIITCCASGIRSASARMMLISKGYKNVINGGGWNSLRKKIK